jgi:hypothetical protein
MSARRLVTCPDCGDPNVPWDTPSQRCDLCSNVCHWQLLQEQKIRQLSNNPTIPPLVERNLMNSLHIQHATNIRGASLISIRTCETCGQTSGNDYLCVYCRNGRQNPNTRAWTPRQQAPAAASAGDHQDDHEFEAFQGLSSDFPKKARLFDISGTTDRELACVICMEDIPPEAPRVYYCECQALICGSCETKTGVQRLTKCPICRTDYKFV